MAQSSIPASPSSSQIGNQGSGFKPHEIDPDLAVTKLAENMMNRMPTPGIVSKPFIVWLGIYRGLNHTAEHKTYLDTSCLVALYESVEHDSVNINGALFEKFFTFLNRPKMVVQGIPGQTTFNDEEQKQSMFERLIGWVRGGEKDNGNKPA